jgi:prephenate dehydrogenase
VTADRTVAVIGPVLVIGSGLIGTSIALALRRADVDVILDDSEPGQVAIGVAMSAGRPLVTDDVPALVVVAVPPRHASEVIARASQQFTTATITDVTSVKDRVLEDAVAAGADPRRLIGGHPMAGREVSGPASARPDLLDDRLWILTPTEQTSVDHLRQAHRLVSTCGAYAIEMSSSDHDRAVALVSHTPQLLSSILAAQLVAASPEHVRVAGAGLRDMTRIAASDSALWTDILGANAAPVADVLDGVVADLQRSVAALRAIADGDATQVQMITDELVSGVVGRARIPGKHGAAASHYAEIAVMLADKPGALGMLFTAVGETAVNLEDIRIEHVLGRQSGLVELSVRPEAAESLTGALRARGFDVRG